MKEISRIRYSLANAVILFSLLFFTACENTDYDLLDPASAGVWTRFTKANSGLPGNEIWDMEIDHSGNLWVSCYGYGLGKYSNGTWTEYNTSNSGILSNNVTAIESTADGKIIVGTTDGIAIRSAAGIWSSYKDPLVTTMDIYSVRITSSGSVYVGTTNEGLYINVSTIYTHANSGNTVYAFEEDRSGNIWMGSSNGLSKWNGSTWTDITVSDGLPDGEVTSLYLDSKDKLWIGVLGADKVYWRDNTGIHGLSLMTGLTGNVIWDICEDKNGDIWFATYGGGLIRYDGVVPHSYKNYNALTSEVFAEDNVNCIAKDAEGNMWFGMTTKGLIRYSLPLN
jgi:ligand-binding sensor domain-containing protein